MIQRFRDLVMEIKFCSFSEKKCFFVCTATQKHKAESQMDDLGLRSVQTPKISQKKNIIKFFTAEVKSSSSLSRETFLD